MTTIEELNEYLAGIFESDDRVNSTYADDAAYVWDNKDVAYPSVAWNIQRITEDDVATTFDLVFYAGARQAEDVDSTTTPNFDLLWSILSTGFDAINADLDRAATVTKPLTYSFAKLKMMDVLAVVTVEASIRFEGADCE